VQPAAAPVVVAPIGSSDIRADRVCGVPVGVTRSQVIVDGFVQNGPAAFHSYAVVGDPLVGLVEIDGGEVDEDAAQDGRVGVV